jgi:hypothetical protein
MLTVIIFVENKLRDVELPSFSFFSSSSSGTDFKIFLPKHLAEELSF